jgi:serine/threonine protein kinase
MHHGSRVRTDGPAAEEPARIGSTIGKYEIVRIVGKGGMGCVYEAVNTTIKKRVAIKCIDHQLLKNDEAYERFHREALAASSVDSPHIVQIFDAGKTDDGVPFIVMELLRGSDLGLVITEHRRLELDDALHVGIQILKGLHHAHAGGIVHRDLKPDNVFLVEREDEPPLVKLLDFGVSKMRSSEVPLQTLTRQGTVVGTPFYMSPEQAQAFTDVDGRTDLYSVGAILYECLTGRPPHVGKSYEQVIVSICMKDADDVRTHNPGVPGELAKVIRKALSRERDDRFKSAREMLDALVDAAPDSFRQATPSSLLRRVTLRTSPSSEPHTPLVISPMPASRPPSVLADTVSVRDAVPLRESGINEKPATLASDLPASDVPRTEAPRKESTTRRRWAVAAAPGIVLLLGLVLYVSFERGASDAARSDGMDERAAPKSRRPKGEDGQLAADGQHQTPTPASPPTPSASAMAATSSSLPSSSAGARTALTGKAPVASPVPVATPVPAKPLPQEPKVKPPEPPPSLELQPK